MDDAGRRYRPASGSAWAAAQCPNEAAHANGDQGWSFAYRCGDAAIVTKCQAGCTRQDAADGLGIGVRELSYGYWEPGRQRREPRPAYEYTDAAGSVLFRKVRNGKGERPRFTASTVTAPATG